MLGALASLAVATIQVVGGDQCPAAQRVAGDLPQLLSPQQLAADHWIFFAVTGGELHLWFLREGGPVLGTRSFDTEGDCESIALAAASQIAGWEADYQALTRSSIVVAPVSEPSPPKVGASELTPAAARPSRWGLTLGIGGGVSVADSASPAALIRFDTFEEGSRAGFGVALSVSLDAERRVSLPLGFSWWSRPRLALGPLLRIPLSPSLWLSLQLDAEIALLEAHGEGPGVGRSFVGANDGIGSSARVVWLFDRLEAWLGVQCAGWFVSQTLVAAGTPGGYTVPQVDAWAAAGVGWRAL